MSGLEGTPVEENNESVSTPDVVTPDVGETPVNLDPFDEKTPDVGGATVEEEWTPNTTFTTNDDKLQFDDFLVGAIKNKENEDRVRDLYERAYGLDYVKESRDRIREEMAGYKAEAEKAAILEKELNRIGDYRRNNDLHSYFEALNLSDDEIFEYAKQKLQLQQDPQQMELYNAQRQQAQKYNEANTQMEALREQNHQLIYQQKQFELDNSLSNDNVARVANAYDQRVGRPGAFKEEVINRGRYHYTVNGNDISAEQAVNEVMNLVGGAGMPTAPTNGQFTQNQAGMPAANTVQSMQTQNVPTIPNLGGGSNTPIKQRPKSFDDLRRKYHEMTS